MENNDAKTIRFIDSQYNTLFWIPDGEKITLTRSDGEKRTLPCAYIDEVHTKIGSNVFHICEFAERMEQIGTSYAPEKPPALPARCFSVQPETGELILIEKGKKGYQVCGWGSEYPSENRREADRMNRNEGVTKQLEGAMLGGALYGWRTRAANPVNYDFQGSATKDVRPPKHRDMER